ncbi:Transcription and mRNA export factor [Phytophthora megakarya]|uniref:Transcription and mRNA export factor n=1 Tax=Phytophthora megakarya TaxID=4795 RepID=A0A225V575_9STRA|nr:Transcription and mRNA export factor [Phytophthora megakarya]
MNHWHPEKDIDQVTVEDLIEEITPKGRASVPEEVKNDLLQKIKAFIEKEAEVKMTTDVKDLKIDGPK